MTSVWVRLNLNRFLYQSMHSPMENGSAAFGDQQAGMAGTWQGEISGLHSESYRAQFSGKDMSFGETILIIGDEQNLRTTLAAILQRAGYVITTSGSADEALLYLREKCFDLVFLDLKMTELNRIELLPEIKHRHPGTPVVLLTSLGLNEVPEAADELAADGYLLKPIDPARIVACANEVIQKSRSVRGKRLSDSDIHPAPDDTDISKS